jgi:predicted small lipoprotein YifL
MRGVRCAIMVLMLLHGCGLKGPLYIPTEKQKKDMAERERLLKEREARRQGQAVPQTAPPAETAPPAGTAVPPAESDVDLLPEVAPPPLGVPPQMEPAAPPPP